MRGRQDGTWGGVVRTVLLCLGSLTTNFSNYSPPFLMNPSDVSSVTEELSVEEETAGSAAESIPSAYEGDTFESAREEEEKEEERGSLVPATSTPTSRPNTAGSAHLESSQSSEPLSAHSCSMYRETLLHSPKEWPRDCVTQSWNFFPRLSHDIKPANRSCL